jgi:hypothetical protein
MSTYKADETLADRTMPQFRLYSLLSALSLPEHLDGVKAAQAGMSQDERQGVSLLLHHDGTVDTRFSGFTDTELTMLKEECWEAILRLDLPQTATWIVEALQETNPFVASRICQIAGYLRIAEAVPHLAQLIARNDWEQGDGMHAALGFSILEALGNIGTNEAFDALAASRFSFENRWPGMSVPDTTPVDYPEAIASCIVGMNNAAPLVAIIEQGPESAGRRWLGSAIAAEYIGVARPTLLTPYRDRMLSFVRRSLTESGDIDSSEYLRFAISTLVAYDYDAETAELLRARAGGSDETAVYCLEVLARWNVLADDEKLLCRLGLVSTGGVWHVGQELGYREAFVTGLLFASNPTMFAPAICDIISTGSFQSAVQVLQQLSAKNATEEVVNHLAKRAHRINAKIVAEGEPLRTLRKIAPGRFVSEFPPEVVKNWRASVRESIVREYVKLESGLSQEPLYAFLTDPASVIRRRAARALAEIDEAELSAQVAILADSPDPELRSYAVEAAVYLGDDTMFARFVRRAREDRELVTRKAAMNAENDRRAVMLARRYTQWVWDATSDELHSVWRYGQALIRLGDDETISDLQRPKDDLLPNQVAYLSYLCKEIEKAWDARRKERDSQNSEW